MATLFGVGGEIQWRAAFCDVGHAYSPWSLASAASSAVLFTEVRGRGQPVEKLLRALLGPGPEAEYDVCVVFWTCSRALLDLRPGRHLLFNRLGFSAKLAQRGSNTYERPWLRSTSSQYLPDVLDLSAAPRPIGPGLCRTLPRRCYARYAPGLDDGMLRDFLGKVPMQEGGGVT
jgi:hypothetical protein